MDGGNGNFDLGENLRQVAAVIGRASAMKLVGASSKHRKYRGKMERRVCVYVPHDPRGSRLEEMIGIDDAAKLSKEFGGITLHLGCGTSVYRQFRDNAVVGMLAEGWPVKHVAWMFDMSERQVRNIRPPRWF